MSHILYFLLLIPSLMWSQSVFEKSEKLFEQGSYAIAKSGFETYLKQHPDHLKTLQSLGEIACRMGDWDTALFYFERLKKIRPTQADYYYLYGGALGLKAQSVSKIRALGLINDIRESFEKAIQLNPKHIEARWGLIEYYLNLPYLLGGGETKAMRYANELMQISPIDGYLAKGYVFEHSKEYIEAEKYYLKAIETGHSYTAYSKLAKLYKNKMHLPEKAKTILDTYSKRNG